MLRRPLARPTSRRGPLGLALVLVLAPLPAFTEENPPLSVPPADPGVAAAPAPEPGLEPQTAIEASQAQTAWAVDRTVPDDPWLVTATRAPDALKQAACDPWNRAAQCTEEAEGSVLSNPWPAEALAAPVPAPPAPVNEAREADLRLRLRGEAVDLRVDVEWPMASVPVSCVPTEAEVRVEGEVDARRLSGHVAGKISPLDTLVIDLGVPEAPFD